MQLVSRLNVVLTAEPCRSSLTGFKPISGNELKNIILSAKPKTCSLDPLPDLASKELHRCPFTDHNHYYQLVSCERLISFGIQEVDRPPSYQERNSRP